MKSLKRHWLITLAWGICRILTGTHKNLNNLHFNYSFWPKLCLMALKIDEIFEGKLTYAFKTDVGTLENFHRLTNSNFISESKMVAVNQNKNSKQPDWPFPVRKLVNKSVSQLTKLFPDVLQNYCFWGIRSFPIKLLSYIIFFNVQYICF